LNTTNKAEVACPPTVGIGMGTDREL